jgi:hypothetical protein
LTLIETIFREFKQLSRYELAATVCENLPWKAQNGRLKINGCRLLLECMAEVGLIVLPPKKLHVKRTICNTKVPPIPKSEIKCSLSQLRPVTVDPVPFEDLALWNATVTAHHPLGLGQPFGAHQLLLGLLMFVFRYNSRREANREMTRPGVLEILRTVFPEVDSCPHMDTLPRVLESISADEIEVILGKTVRRLSLTGSICYDKLN